MKVGPLEIDLVSDGQVWVDPGGAFGLVPKALYERYWPPNEEHLIPMSLHSLVVRVRGTIVLIDTGLGTKLSPKAAKLWRLERPQGDLLEGLRRIGLVPEDIDVVINTHLHADHCSGNTMLVDGELRPTFPNAEYWVQRMEWADASHPDARTKATYLPENFQPLLRGGQLRLLHGDTRLNDHIRCVVTPGHTRGHQSVILEAGDWRGMFVADMASFAIKMAKTAWVSAYDVLPLENVATKERWQRWALEHDAWLFFEHDGSMPVARLERRGGKLELAPVAWGEIKSASIPT
ncbi:MAG TPA: MBL fold metallo-hydrolase [Chloroflexi bacterium]|nr:MBL fold metallo-hydrolase [Chloroflexota bacterium]